MLGRFVTRSISCSNCNFENDEGNEFCINCESSLDHSTAPSHKIINSSRVSVSGSYDAMSGAKKYGQEKKTTKDSWDNNTDSFHYHNCCSRILSLQ